MRAAVRVGLLTMGVLISGCAPTLRVPPPPVAPPTTPLVAPPPPHFEKTFGAISVGNGASLVLHYKSITLVLDPDMDASAGSIFNQVDYLLLTDAEPRHFSPGLRGTLRKNIKIICSAEETSALKKDGFSAVKDLATGQRILLKKDADFVFVSATQNRSLSSNRLVNGYLLEFDNGRNIFIAGETPSADSLREFLYGLRDDGKEIYTGFFYRQPGLNETTLAQIIGLIQPKHALITQNDLPGLPPLNEQALQDELKNELFENSLSIVKKGDEIQF